MYLTGSDPVHEPYADNEPSINPMEEMQTQRQMMEGAPGPRPFTCIIYEDTALFRPRYPVGPTIQLDSQTARNFVTDRGRARVTDRLVGGYGERS